mgnify:CR=1 FL=1
MSEMKKNLSDLIKANIDRVKKIITDKEKSVQLIEQALSEIKKALDNKVIFSTTTRVDSDNDTVHYVYVENQNTQQSEYLFMYYFHQVNIFPLMFNYNGEVVRRCDDLEELNETIERLMASESFMIKIITIAAFESGEENHDF